MKGRWFAVNLVGLILAGCGGGGGASSPTVAVSVSAAKTPVLLSYTSNRVQVAFPGATTVPDGTQVVFTASSPNISLLPATATVTGGVVTIRVKSALAGKYLVTATSTVGSTVYTGSTYVTFITQPSSVRLSIALQPVVSNLGSLQFNILNDPGISVFQNFTSVNPGFTVVTNPSPGLAPPANSTTVGAVSANGVTVASSSPLFAFTYGIGANGGLPGFAIDPASVHAFTTGNTALPTPTFLLSWKYDTDTF